MVLISHGDKMQTYLDEVSILSNLCGVIVIVRSWIAAVRNHPHTHERCFNPGITLQISFTRPGQSRLSKNQPYSNGSYKSSPEDHVGISHMGLISYRGKLFLEISCLPIKMSSLLGHIENEIVKKQNK